MAVPKLPAGWSVEMLGLISAVKFTHKGGRTMMWCDGQWIISHDGKLGGMTAFGIPVAKTMDQARRVGSKFLVECEAE